MRRNNDLVLSHTQSRLLGEGPPSKFEVANFEAVESVLENLDIAVSTCLICSNASQIMGMRRRVYLSH